MNYRHAFHAGNFADVLKHLVLTSVLNHMSKKAAPFRVIDTHAGAGLYDLGSIAAEKTGEWRAGIGRLVESWEKLPDAALSVLKPYLDVLESDFGVPADGERRLVRYPGSPLIARRLLREGDALIVNELHAEEREQLADLFHRDRQTKVMGLDGYTALKALLPPKERRGLVLVDPPFEVAGEFDRLAGAVSAAHKRFASGVLVLWFPIKDRAVVDRFYERLADAGLAKALAVELQIAALDSDTKGLVATGLVVVNPPYTLAQDLDVVLPTLVDVLGAGPEARASVRWLVAEATGGPAAG